MALAHHSTSIARPSIHDLSADEKKALMRKEWSGESRFQKEFGTDAKDLDCGDFGQQFAREVLRILQSKGALSQNVPLADIHKHIAPELRDYNYDDGVNEISKLLYDTDETFVSLYHRFIKECVQRYFRYPFYFQQTTTVRIHCPDGKHANHYPRYHSDIGYGHPAQEINIWIPLTEPQPPQQHGFRCMSLEDSREVLEAFDYDFAPFIDKAINDKPFNYELNKRAPQVATPRGKMRVFDSRCIHTGEPLEHHSRASIDIRILPVADYHAMPITWQGSGRRKMLYIPGQGYHEKHSGEL